MNIEFAIELRRRTRDWLKYTHGFERDANAVLPLLQQTAASEDERIEAVRQLLTIPSFHAIAGDAILRGDVKVEQWDTTAPQRLVPETRDDRGGSVWIVFQDIQVKIAELVTVQPFRAMRLQPLVEILCRVETQKLANLVKAVIPIYVDQASLARSMLKEAKEILSQHDRWTSTVSITNIGESPLVIDHRRLTMSIKSPSLKRTALPCHLLERRRDLDGPENTSWEAGHGLVVVPPHKSTEVAMVTQQYEAELGQIGKQLRAAFGASRSFGWVTLGLVSKGSLWKQTCRSQAAQFARKVEDAQTEDEEANLIAGSPNSRSSA